MINFTRLFLSFSEMEKFIKFPAAITITIAIITIFQSPFWLCTAENQQELVRGFKISPDLSVSSFQAILNDSTGNFSLGFLRVDGTKLAVVILHVPSSEQIWIANPTDLATWSDKTQLVFNGSFVVSDEDGTVFWSTATDGDRVVLLNSSNLQIHRSGDPPVILWQSFDFPADTVVVNQRFTSDMTLISSNRFYSMRLGDDFIGLYAEFNTGKTKNQIYYKRRALQAKATVVHGGGPLHLRLNSDGYLGLYQNGTLPVDLQAFNTFHKSPNGFLRLRLEPDGNLKGFFWEGSTWILDYQSIYEQCELPNPCGSYGLCEPGSGCSCIDNRTEHISGQCLPSDSGNFCSEGVATNNFWILQRTGVELPFKELMEYKTGFTSDQCNNFCQTNCACWGSLYNNSTGFCHWFNYPVRTVVAVSDGSKIGYFKVREVPTRSKLKVGLEIGLGILVGIVGLVLAVLGFAGIQAWRRRRGIGRFFDEDDGSVSPGPYKDLGSASFKSIEMGSGFGR